MVHGAHDALRPDLSKLSLDSKSTGAAGKPAVPASKQRRAPGLPTAPPWEDVLEDDLSTIVAGWVLADAESELDLCERIKRFCDTRRRACDDKVWSDAAVASFGLRDDRATLDAILDFMEKNTPPFRTWPVAGPPFERTWRTAVVTICGVVKKQTRLFEKALVARNAAIGGDAPSIFHELHHRFLQVGIMKDAWFATWIRRAGSPMGSLKDTLTSPREWDNDVLLPSAYSLYRQTDAQLLEMETHVLMDVNERALLVHVLTLAPSPTGMDAAQWESMFAELVGNCAIASRIGKSVRLDNRFAHRPSPWWFGPRNQAPSARLSNALRRNAEVIFRVPLFNAKARSALPPPMPNPDIEPGGSGPQTLPLINDNRVPVLPYYFGGIRIWNEDDGAPWDPIYGNRHPHSQRNFNFTPLAMAAWAGDSWMVHKLLEMGAGKDVEDVDAPNGRNGLPALVMAAASKVRCYQATDELPSEVECEGGSQVGIVMRLLEAKADVNKTCTGAFHPYEPAGIAPIDAGYTALLWAATYGNSSVVDVLLDAGADINARSAHNTNALGLAAESGHEGVVRVLLARLGSAAGAMANSPDNDGDTAWSMAMHNWENLPLWQREISPRTRATWELLRPYAPSPAGGTGAA